jgi:hypothetical protein
VPGTNGKGKLLFVSPSYKYPFPAPRIRTSPLVRVPQFGLHVQTPPVLRAVRLIESGAFASFNLVDSEADEYCSMPLVPVSITITSPNVA